MTDRKAKCLSLLLLHKPKYILVIDSTMFEYSLYKAMGAHVMKFNLADYEWYPVRHEKDRDRIVAIGKPISRDQAAKIIGEHLV